MQNSIFTKARFSRTVAHDFIKIVWLEYGVVPKYKDLIKTAEYLGMAGLSGFTKAEVLELQENITQLKEKFNL